MSPFEIANHGLMQLVIASTSPSCELDKGKEYCKANYKALCLNSDV